MTQELRDLMHRVADTAPPVSVADDTWARARRVRRREIVAAPVLAVALLLGAVTLGLQAGWLPGGSEVAPAASVEAGSGAVPKHVYAVPDRLDRLDSSGGWSHPREPLSVVRRASAGYVTTSGGAVLVSARDGVHHLVELSGFNDRYIGMHDEGPVLAVSPDGRRLAYFWRQRVPGDGERVPSGLAVVELGSGELRTHPLPGGLGVRVSSLGWSPDGRYVVYRVGVLTRVDASGGFSVGGYRMERLDVDTGERTVLPPRIARVSGAAAVSGDGVVAVAAGTTLFTWSSDRAPQVRTRELAADLSGASAWSPTGERVALGSVVPTDAVTVASSEGDVVDSPRGTEPLSVQVLGWVGRDYVVAVRHPETWTKATIDLLPVDAGHGRRVGVVDSGVQLDSFTVATGLMSPERPTVQFDPPAWERDTTWWWLGGGGALVLVAGAAAIVVRRRT
jgi:hypothetical protein